MSDSRRSLFALLLVLSLWAPDSLASMDISGHFRGLRPDAGGLAVIGGRFRYERLDLGVQSFSGGLALSGGLRWVWNERGRLTPSFGVLGRTGLGAIEVGPSISVSLQLFSIGSSAFALRLDQELWLNTSSRNLDPNLLLGASWIFP